ncbi:MAG: hypothetical protein V4649_19605 [Bacteroidota bacterium]
MATYEVYLGGPSSNNASRAAFPAPTFAAAGAAFKAMRPTQHKGRFLNRVLDFGKDMGLAHFIRTQLEDGAPVTTADILGALMIPQNVVVHGAFYEVEVAGNAALTMTPAFRVGAQTLPIIVCSALSKGYAGISEAAWSTSNASVLAGAPVIMHTPDMLDLAVTAIGSGFGALRLNIGLLISDLTSGEY